MSQPPADHDLPLEDAQRVEKRLSLSTTSGIPWGPCDVDKVPEFFTAAPLADAPSDALQPPGEPLPIIPPPPNLSELLDHLRIPRDKVSKRAKVEIADRAARRGRPVLFDELAKAKALGLITAGLSQRTAAALLGIDHSTISKAIRSDPQFARAVELSKAASRGIRPVRWPSKAVDTGEPSTRRPWKAIVLHPQIPNPAAKRVKPRRGLSQAHPAAVQFASACPGSKRGHRPVTAVAHKDK